MTGGKVALKGGWRCSEPDCPERGEGTAKEAEKAAERHGKAERHATVAWAEPTLPIAIKR